VVAILRRRGEPMTVDELWRVIEQEPQRGVDAPASVGALRNLLESAAPGKAAIRAVRIDTLRADCPAPVALCWRVGALQIDTEALIAFALATASDASSVTSAASAAGLQTPVTAKKRSASAALQSGGSQQKSFKSPFRPVTTPKSANVHAAAAVVAQSPLIAAVERYVAAHTRLAALKVAGATPMKIATRNAQTRPLDNDDRLEELTKMWQAACSAAFDALLPKQRDNVSGKLLTRRALGRALQVEPWHIGLTEWSDDEDEEQQQQQQQQQQNDIE
jgi:hypothetical protein